MKTQCKTHGDRPWDGRCACTRCERAYNVSRAGSRNYPPPWCRCGAKLLPTEEGERTELRPVCDLCQRAQRERRKTRRAA